MVLVVGIGFIGLAAWIGYWAVLAVVICIPLFTLLLNYRAAFLLMIALIPNLGEIEADQYHPLFWMFGFIPLICAWTLALVLRPSSIRLPLIPAFFFVLLFIAAVVSHLGGHDLKSMALIRQDRDWPFWQTVDFFTSFGIGFMAMTAFRNRRDLEKIYLAFIVSGIPYAVTIFFFGHEVDPLTGAIETGGRTQGFYGHPHMASTHMIVCAILAANYARYTKGRMRWFAVGCIVLFLATLAFASSKTTVAAMPIIVFIWAAMEFGPKRALVTTAALIAIPVLLLPILPGSVRRDVAIIGAALVGNSDPHSRTLGGQGKLNTFKERFIQIDEGFEMIKERPVFGHGPGRITHVSKIPARFAGPQVHNYYVQLYVELGIVGGTIFVALILCVLMFGFFNTLALRGDPVWHLARGLFLSSVMVALIVTLNSGSVGLRIIWCCLGLLAGVERLLLPARSSGQMPACV